MIPNKIAILLILLFVGSFQWTSAQESKALTKEELAKKLANPIASLISVPFQNNMDLGIGPNNGSRNTLNIQPVVPISLGDKMNLITRWVQPVISQYDISGEGTSEFGLSDAVVSAFFSPTQSAEGLTWGAGPVFLVPTATDQLLGTEKFGVGPTAVALYQSNGWTFGGLVNQIWSVAGNDNRGDVNQMFIQPFMTYNWKSGAGIGGNFEITQNWETNSTNAWFNPFVNAITSLGNQKTQFLIGPRFNFTSSGVPSADFGVRAQLVFLFPK
ncbi:hypothetical protein KFE98_01715 [bacterium SCSIO 12741]|nr:hypothetical protein KFE98_01715 [bacterium SCSIO 12741]